MKNSDVLLVQFLLVSLPAFGSTFSYDSIFHIVDDLREDATRASHDALAIFAHHLHATWPTIRHLSSTDTDEFLISNAFSNQTASLSNQCLLDLLFLVQSTKKLDFWSLEVFDSWGRPTWGLLRGNNFWTGSYDQCLNVSVTGNVSVDLHFTERLVENASFDGQYCVAKFVNKSLTNCDTVINGNLKTGIMFGICIPQTCSGDGISLASKFIVHLFNNSLSQLNLTYSGVSCKKVAQKIDGLGVVTIIVLGVMVSFVLIVSISHCLKRNVKNSDENRTENRESLSTADDDTVSHHSESNINSVPILPERSLDFSPLRKCLEASDLFSIQVNLKRLLFVRDDVTAETRNDELNFLHGIRFLSLAWIILGHTYYFSFAILENILDVLNPYMHNISSQVIIQGPYAVDSFFVLSGMLVAYNFFHIAERNPSSIKKCKFWVSFYLCRIWRLTPTYMLLLLAYIGLFKYLGNGPFWSEDGLDANYCRSVWWANLLYINNLVNFRDSQSDGNTVRCFGWSWFLAVDMQMFLFSPLILYPLFRSRYHRRYVYTASFVIICAVLAGLITTGVLVSTNRLPPNIIPPDVTTASRARDLEVGVYFKPYPHIVCYITGILVGYVCAYKEEYAARFRFSRTVVCALWILSTCLGLAVVFGLFPQYRSVVYSRHVSAFYYSCSRLAFSFSLAWVILACRFGHAGYVNKLLSWKFFVPLSRLTFCAYLIHPIVMFVYYFSRRHTMYYTDFTMVWFFGSFMLFTYLSALVITLFFESPFGVVRKLIKTM